MTDHRILEAGDTAPDFELTTLRGDETFRLSAQRGRNVLLFFIREFS